MKRLNGCKISNQQGWMISWRDHMVVIDECGKRTDVFLTKRGAELKLENKLQAIKDDIKRQKTTNNSKQILWIHSLKELKRAKSFLKQCIVQEVE